MCDLHNRTVFPHSSGGSKSKVKVMARLVPSDSHKRVTYSKPSPVTSRRPPSLCPLRVFPLSIHLPGVTLCDLISPSSHDTSKIEESPL